jgi:hypothetical protein
MSPAQHAVPGMPHTSQRLLPPQRVCAAVHVAFAQHGSPAAPHTSHTLPAEHTEPVTVHEPAQHA